MDRFFYFGCIIAALVVISKRQVRWPDIARDNWPVFLFYGYLLVSVLWADSPFVSLRRWIKEFGNIAVLLVILTEVDPQEAFRTVFVRAAYVWFPLSVIFIRWFPSLGRHYNSHNGGMEAGGVTFQKNSLGAMVLVCGLILVWDWLEKSTPDRPREARFDRYFRLLLLGMGAYLIRLSDSKTSIACLLLGAGIIISVKVPALRRKIGVYGAYALACTVGFYLLDQIFDISEVIVRAMGRDMTFTGRTDVWRALLALKTDPLFGTGFLSFWSDQYYQSQLPEWVASSAHNGYLEMYIDGGLVGVCLLIVMLGALGTRFNRELSRSGNYALARFSILIVAVIVNFSESNFARNSGIGFLFLTAAINIPWSINYRRGIPTVVHSVRQPTVPATLTPLVPASTCGRL